MEFPLAGLASNLTYKTRPRMFSPEAPSSDSMKVHTYKPDVMPMQAALANDGLIAFIIGNDCLYGQPHHSVIVLTYSIQTDVVVKSGVSHRSLTHLNVTRVGAASSPTSRERITTEIKTEIIIRVTDGVVLMDRVGIYPAPHHASHVSIHCNQCRSVGFIPPLPASLTWQHKSISRSCSSCLPNVVVSGAGLAVTVCDVSLAVASGCIVFVMTALVTSFLAATVVSCWTIDTSPATERSLSRISAAVKPSKSLPSSELAYFSKNEGYSF